VLKFGERCRDDLEKLPAVRKMEKEILMALYELKKPQ
jgi:hypothetical protein